MQKQTKRLFRALWLPEGTQERLNVPQDDDDNNK